MIIASKGDFSMQTTFKNENSSVALQNAFYPDFRICLALEGEAVWTIEGRAHRICKGDIVFLKMGQERHFSSFGKAGFRFCTFILKRNVFAGPHHFVFFLEQIREKGSVIRDPMLSWLLTELYEEWDPQDPLRYELASARLTTFFIKAERLEGYLAQSVSEKHQRMLEIMDYIDANIQNGISLQAAAEKAGMTESAFSRRFSEINGISFKQYVVEKKIQRAITLLQTTDRKILDIAMDCGFESISGFYSAFRKKTGTTPANFSETE